MKKNKTKPKDIVVFTAGVFDLLHPGHINLLRRAKKLGAKLVVALQTDKSVKEQKGRSPVLSFKYRKMMLKSLSYVNRILPYSHSTYTKAVQEIDPEIVAQGGDWFDTGNRTKTMEFLKKSSIKFVKLPHTPGISTTEIKRKIFETLLEESINNKNNASVK